MVANIIDLIRSMPEEEQVLMFVQFDNLMHNIVSAVNAEGIPNYGFTASSGRAVRNMVDDFQNRGPTKKILVLNWANSLAAGVTTVHIYDFLALQVTDVDLYQAQDRKTFVRQSVNGDSQWEMVDPRA
ncbi:hypothetical protein HO133_008217 [Letharia lupina]|uniref:Helicase C-terminal domain-containing protein n=1 Tax=Letharia lupina TaxID=560253 RepID=A0A8H6FH84_9LECA|nr:uncharacterized protein HO133_008217 [Letharia lupina]KAF6228487.1 hypothetical protein HO133_008217 [Letharia lupina]